MFVLPIKIIWSLKTPPLSGLLERRHDLTYCFTQLLTRHGCFGRNGTTAVWVARSIRWRSAALAEYRRVFAAVIGDLWCPALVQSMVRSSHLRSEAVTLVKEEADRVRRKPLAPAATPEHDAPTTPDHLLRSSPSDPDQYAYSRHSISIWIGNCDRDLVISYSWTLH